MNLDHYDYHLPGELIAQHPLPNRDSARLLIVDRTEGTISHRRISDLPEFLSAEDAVVINNTQVVAARLVGYRVQTGGKWEGLFLSVDDKDNWNVLSKTRGKLSKGEVIQLLRPGGTESHRLLCIEKQTEGGWLMQPENISSWVEILEDCGHVPIPPYIRGGKMESDDRHQYQTVYARCPGAIAAPTAGLHFTAELLSEITRRGTRVCEVTLHVGIGTFRPVKVQRLEDHTMHSEQGELNSGVASELQDTRRSGGKIVAVGTTVVRVLETAVCQDKVIPWRGKTDLFIRPPYEFKTVDALLTNFHLPKSTLLVLVREFGGDDLIQQAYREAIRLQYRFYSYGDAMLII